MRSSRTSTRKEWSCGKRRYRDDAGAKRALRHFKGMENAPVRAYLCLKCKGWHLTSQA